MTQEFCGSYVPCGVWQNLTLQYLCLSCRVQETPYEVDVVVGPGKQLARARTHAELMDFLILGMKNWLMRFIMKI